MNFLLVLGGNEQNWIEDLEYDLKRLKHQVTAVDSVEAAQGLLADPNTKVDHIISGTLCGGWRTVHEAVSGRGIGMTILTAALDSATLDPIKEAGLPIIDKWNYDIQRDIRERFAPQRSGREAIR